jgi:hypothetical protein
MNAACQLQRAYSEQPKNKNSNPTAYKNPHEIYQFTKKFIEQLLETLIQHKNLGACTFNIGYLDFIRLDVYGLFSFRV